MISHRFRPLYAAFAGMSLVHRMSDDSAGSDNPDDAGTEDEGDDPDGEGEGSDDE